MAHNSEITKLQTTALFRRKNASDSHRKIFEREMLRIFFEKGISVTPIPPYQAW